MLKRLLAAAAVILMASLLASSAIAGGARAKHQQFKGHVTAVDTTITPNTITIQHKKDAPKTFTLTAATKVKVDHAVSALDKVQVGMHAMVASDDGATAIAIRAHTKSHARKGAKGKA